jgi:hypothetical protein
VREGERAIQNRIKEQAEGRIKLLDFTKSNGAKGDVMGLKIYALEFDAAIEFTEDCKWVVGIAGEQLSFNTRKSVPQPQSGFAWNSFLDAATNPGTQVKKGQCARVSGVIRFVQKEKGWAVETIELTKGNLTIEKAAQTSTKSTPNSKSTILPPVPAKAEQGMEDFTDPAPATLPVVQMPPEKLAAIRRRADDFRDAVRAHKTTEPLKLTSDELNALINFDADLQPLKGKIYVEMKGNDLGAQLIIPMADIGLEAFRGRYLNGHGKFALSLKYGALKVLTQDLNVKGQPVPDIYMNTIRKQNLAKGFNTNPRASIVSVTPSTTVQQSHRGRNMWSYDNYD